ncbi:MAG: sensor histidine kinase [Pseudobdellovibrionaceae bacterium]
MTELNEYQNITLLDQQDGFSLFHAIRKIDQYPVLLKQMTYGPDRAVKSEKLKNEFQYLKGLSGARTFKPLSLESFDDKQFIVFEDFPGISLEAYLKGPQKCKEFLHIGIELTKAVAEIHSQSIIHKDIKPQNIFIDPTNLKIKLGGFTSATLLPSEQQVARPANMIEGSLPYMSPEQTGRMNRSIDHRSDLYSLGITFYQMLAGAFPFDAQDPIEWVYCHVAQDPRPLSIFNPDVPTILEKVILTLLEKMAENRYQSAGGLQYDLEFILSAWTETSSVQKREWLSDFKLKTHDYSKRFIISQRLYGREQEVAVLYKDFRGVVETGKSKLTLIAGYSGIGKTSLVNELHKFIVKEHGFYISGKADQYKRNMPFNSLLQAFQQLIFGILVEKEERLAIWKEKIISRVGSHLRLLVDVLPQLESLVGRGPAVPELSFQESQIRFRLTFQNFINVFTQKEHPLTIFLDDVQWIDSASLELIKELLINDKMGCLFIIMAYRENEVTVSHPFSLWLDEMNHTAIKLSKIELKSISVESLKHFVSDTLSCSLEKADPLAALIYDKTLGNPFFVIQFLQSTYSEGFVIFDDVKREWTWDIEKIRKKNYTDNLVDFVTKKIADLPPSAKELLMIFSCLNVITDINTFSLAAESSQEKIYENLWEALVQGIVVKLDGQLKFLHDQLREVSFNLIEPSQRAKRHLHLARIFLSKLSKNQVHEQIFEVVRLLNLGISEVQTPDERENSAELNFLAAQKAYAATAFQSAADYCRFGQAYLDSDNIEGLQSSDLLFKLGLLRAKAELAGGHISESEQQIEELLPICRNKYEQAKRLQVQIEILTSYGQTTESIKRAIDFLKMFNISISENPSSAEAMAYKVEIDKKLQHFNVKDLEELPLMNDVELEEAMGVLSGILPNSYYTNVNLWRISLYKMLDITLTQGICRISPITFATYAFDLCVLESYKESVPYIWTAIEIINRHDYQLERGKVLNLLAIIITPWTSSFSQSIKYLRESVAQGSDDIFISCISQIYIPQYAFEAGESLSQVERLVEEALDFVLLRKNDLLGDGAIIFQRVVWALQGRTFQAISFANSQDEENLLAQRLRKHPHPAVKIWFEVAKLSVAVFYKDTLSAIYYANLAAPLLSLAPGQQAEVNFVFFAAIAKTDAWIDCSENERMQYRADLSSYIQRLKLWSDVNPQNYSHRYELVSAELARIEGNELEAQRRFQFAIDSAQKNGFVQFTALSYERAAYFYEERGLTFLAQACLREATKNYFNWGAHGKVKQLEIRYSFLREFTEIFQSKSLSFYPEQFELLSAVKASQSISEEIEHNHLVESLLKVVLEQSGGKKGILLLLDENDLYIEAIATLESTGVKSKISRQKLLDSMPDVPTSLIRYVQRTKELFIVEEGISPDSNFFTDSYINKSKSLSVLCLPITRGTILVGILYLENKNVKGVFSPQRLEVLKLLASQAAISLQNARFFGQKDQALLTAQKSIQARDEFLSLASHELKTPLTALRLTLDFLKSYFEEITPSSLEEQSSVSSVLNQADKSLDRLIRFSKDLVDVSRIRSDALKLHISEFDLCLLLREIISEHQHDFEMAKCSLSTNFPIEAKGRWDRLRLKQVFEELLSNSLKYGSENLIEITIKNEDSEVKVTFRDHGIGISKEAQVRLFGYFAREGSIKNYEGLGLGLFISKGIIEAHGGTISVESEIGKGSTFIVNIRRQTLSK